MKNYIYILIATLLLFLSIKPIYAEIGFGSNSICSGSNDGVLSVTFNGGCPPYYVVVNSNSGYLQHFPNVETGELVIENLSEGTYTAAVKDNNGCILIGEYTMPTFEVDAHFTNVTPAIIDGEAGTITIYVEGTTNQDGWTEPFSITWTNETNGNVEVIGAETLAENGEVTISGLEPGEYCAEVIRNGCSKKICTTIDSHSLCICDDNEISETLEYMLDSGNGIIITPPDPSSGGGGSISFDESLFPCNGPFSYSYEGKIQVGMTDDGVPVLMPVSNTSFPSSSPLIENLSYGIYTIIVEDACGDAGEIRIRITEECIYTGTPLFIEGATVATHCQDGEGEIFLEVNNDSNQLLTYVWSNGATTPNIVDLDNGEYCVTVMNNDGCSDSECYEISSDLILDLVEVTVPCSGAIGPFTVWPDEGVYDQNGSITIKFGKGEGIFPVGDVYMNFSVYHEGVGAYNMIKQEFLDLGPNEVVERTFNNLEPGQYSVSVMVGDTPTDCFRTIEPILLNSTPITGQEANCTQYYYCGDIPAGFKQLERTYDFPNGNCNGYEYCKSTGQFLGEYSAFEGDIEDFGEDGNDCQELLLECITLDGQIEYADVPDDDSNIVTLWEIGEFDENDPIKIEYCNYIKYCEPTQGDVHGGEVMEILEGPTEASVRYVEIFGVCLALYSCIHESGTAVDVSGQNNNPLYGFWPNGIPGGGYWKEVSSSNCPGKMPHLPIEVASTSYINILVNYLAGNSLFNNLYTIGQFDQNLHSTWEESLSGEGNIWGTDIATLNDGSVLSVGNFTEDIRDDNDWLYSSNGVEDIFFVRHNIDGEREWLKTFGGVGTDECNSVAVDELEHIWFTGSFTDEMYIENERLTGTGQETYIAQYNRLGYLLWAKALEGTDENRGLAIETDSENNAYVLGNFKADIQLSEGKSLKNNDNYLDMFLAKYDEGGELIWRKHGISIATDFEDADLAVDRDGNIIVYGAFKNRFNFTLNSENSISAPGYKKDLFLVKYSPKGELLWTRQMGNTADEMYIGGIETDRYGNILVNGGFEGKATFEGVSLVADGERNIFVAQYNSNGQLTWVKKEGGIKKNTATCIGINDVDGNIYYAGFHYGNAVIEGGEFISHPNAQKGFVVELGGQSQQAKKEVVEEKKEEVITSEILIDKIYPNPFQQEIQIDIEASQQEEVTFQMYSLMGVEVLSEKHQLEVGKNTIFLKMKDKAAGGVYLLKVIDGKKQVTTHKVVKTSN